MEVATWPMAVTIPGRGTLQVEHLVLDVNGTVAANGELIPGVAQRLNSLKQRGLRIHWITADSRGLQSHLDRQMGWPAVRISASELGTEAANKAAFVRQLGASQVISIGNGSNDAEMLQAAALGIAVLGPEGLAVDALLAADVLVRDIHDALDLVDHPIRLVATCRR